MVFLIVNASFGDYPLATAEVYFVEVEGPEPRMMGLFGHKEEQPLHFDGTALLQQSLHILWREYRQHFHHIIEVGNVVILRSEVQTLHKCPFWGRDRQLENPLSGGGDSGVGIEYFGGKQPERNSPVVFSEPKR